MPQDERTSRDFPLLPSTLENIDSAVYEYINEELNIHATTNKGFKKVPVIWVSAERAFQIKHKKELRDGEGSLVFPLLTVQRVSVDKSLDWKGTYFGNVPPRSGYDPRGGSITVASQVKQDKTANFQNAEAKYRRNQSTYPHEAKKVVNQSISIPMPRYLDMNYKITGRSNFQQQANELMEPIMALGGGVKYIAIERDGHFYEVFVDSAYEQNDDHVGNLEDDARTFETSVKFRVLGYLYGAGTNEERPIVSVREGVTEFKVMRERVMTQDEIDDFFKKDAVHGIGGKYRE